MRIASSVRRVVHEYQRLHFAGPRSHAIGWQPSMNIYVSDGTLDVCLDVAGVSLDDIEIRVEGNRLFVEGDRPSPERWVREDTAECRRILAMEIECGRFSRVIDLPIVVDKDEVQVDFRQGLLWIRVPLRSR